MTYLKKESILGLTFGQILATIALFGGLITAYVSVEVRLAAINVEVQNIKKEHYEQRASTQDEFRNVQTDMKSDFVRLETKIDALHTLIVTNKTN